MVKHESICTKCGKKVESLSFECDKCGGIITLEYELPKSFSVKPENPGIYRYDSLLPLDTSIAVSLGEGNTPLLRLARIEEDFDIGEFYVKSEHQNPTGSFKDRAMAVSIPVAHAVGINMIAVASAGNASSSAAAYGAVYGMHVNAVVPEDTTKSKLLQALAFGAKVVKVKGKYSDAYGMLKTSAIKNKWYNVSTTYINPYNVAGYRTVSYELYEQLGKAPDWVLIPIGAGPLLAGVYQGFDDLLKLGEIEKIPKLAGIQSDRCAPIVKAFEEGSAKVDSWKMKENTVASGLNDELVGYTNAGEYTLEMIRKSGGVALSLTEEEIVDSTLLLAKQGIYAEPAGATGVYAARNLRRNGIIKSGESVAAIATGNGLKNPITDLSFDPEIISDQNELEKILG